jgi:DNA-binding transcriptional LysR family regulator
MPASGPRCATAPTRGVTLTDAGRVLLATADAIHAELQIAAQQLRALQAGGPQALTVVTFPSAGEPLLAPALTAMTAAAGRPVEVTVIEAEPDEALGSVRDGQADLALVYHFHTPQPPRAWPAAAGPGTYTALMADPLRLLIPAGHPLAGRPAVSLAEFAGERWIHGWGDTGGVLDMLAAVSGFQPRVACRSSDYRFMSALVGAGVGVALVSGLALTGAPTCATSRSPPTPPATSAPTSRSGTGPTQPPNVCSQHSTLARSPNRRPRPDTADRRRRANQTARPQPPPLPRWPPRPAGRRAVLGSHRRGRPSYHGFRRTYQDETDGIMARAVI